jgi:hypothetical protein
MTLTRGQDGKPSLILGPFATGPANPLGTFSERTFSMIPLVVTNKLKFANYFQRSY